MDSAPSRIRPYCATFRQTISPDSRLHLPFSALNLHPALIRGLKDLGFTRPTPIQSDAIPAGARGP